MSAETLRMLEEGIGDDLIESTAFRGDETALVRREAWLRAMEFLKSRCGMDMLVDLCAADYPKRGERFEVVAHLRSSETGRRIRVKARCPASEPSIESVSSLWRGAGWFEREAYDLFGIRFEGHRNLRRLLCHEGFDGHPLRKDYPKSRRGEIRRPQTLMDEMEKRQAETDV